MAEKRRKAATFAGRIRSGLLLGAVSGLFGGGGGMVAVPLLERTLPVREAHATAIAAVLPAALSGGIAYALTGRTPAALLIPTALGVSLGGYLGARLLPFLPVKLTDILFAALMLLAGIGMVL